MAHTHVITKLCRANPGYKASVNGVLDTVTYIHNTIMTYLPQLLAFMQSRPLVTYTAPTMRSDSPIIKIGIAIVAVIAIIHPIFLLGGDSGLIEYTFCEEWSAFLDTIFYYTLDILVAIFSHIQAVKYRAILHGCYCTVQLVHCTWFDWPMGCDSHGCALYNSAHTYVRTQQHTVWWQLHGGC